jgi:hypothetical protein
VSATAVVGEGINAGSRERGGVIRDGSSSSRALADGRGGGAASGGAGGGTSDAGIVC